MADNVFCSEKGTVLGLDTHERNSIMALPFGTPQFQMDQSENKGN